MAIISNSLNQKEIWIRNPLQKRSKAKFEAVLAALPQVLNEVGYAKTTTARLALEADISIGSLYNYFSCKEAVLIAYLDHQLNQALNTVLQAVTDQEMEAVTFVREFVRIGVNFAYEQKAFIKIALNEFPEKILNPDLSASREKILQIIAHAEHNRKLNLKNKEPRITVYTLSNIIFGFQFRTVIMPDETLSRDAIVEELTEIITHYLF
jgi:AcrR family transcriptional regulator